MSKENEPLLSEEFLEELAKEINNLYGDPDSDSEEEQDQNDVQKGTA